MNYEDREFQRVVTEGLVPKLKESAVAVAICPSEEGVDAKFCVELGAMIMLDKPIVLVRPNAREIPPKLRLVADHIIEADITTEEGHAEFLRKLAELGLL